jgi:hypothetical protein
MFIRVYGSYVCEKCALLTNGLKLLKIPFEFIDALDEKNDAICDKYSVNALPHVQIFNDDNVVVWEKIKSVSITDVYTQAKHYEIKR